MFDPSQILLRLARCVTARRPAKRAAGRCRWLIRLVGVPGDALAGGPLDLSTMSTGPGAEPGAAPESGQLPAPPPRNFSATGAVASVAPPSDSPKDTYDLGYGYVLRKDYALAEDTFQAFLKKYPTDPPRRRCAILAGREPVPAPAL